MLLPGLYSGGIISAGDIKIEYITHTSVDGGTSIAIPASAQAGDIAIFCDASTNSTGAGPVPVIPTGFTSLTGVGYIWTSVTLNVSYRILGAGEGSNTISPVMNGTGSFNTKMCLLFRPSRPVIGLNSGPFNGQGTQNNPDAQSVTLSDVEVPVMSFVCAWSSNSAGTLALTTQTPAYDQTVTISGGRMISGFTTYYSAPANQTVDIGDTGLNALVSGWIRPLVAGPVLLPIGTGVDNTSLSSYNFGNFYAPYSGLMVVGAIGSHSAARSISGISIGGSAGTMITQSTDTSSTATASIYARTVSAGNNNVTVTMGGGSTSRARVGVWLLTNLASTTPTQTTRNTDNSSSQTITQTLDFPAGGVGIYVARFGIIGAGGLPTWSSARMRLREVIAGSDSIADKQLDSASLSNNESVTIASGTPTTRGYCAAVWR